MQVHPSQISPGEPFDIFYFIRNHTDSTTYYIRAKVYDVRTGELLATHNLTQSAINTRLFTKTVDAPPDPVGYGRNIVAIATVYTDSGYTTKSTDYEEQEQYYLIKAQVPFVGGGGGVDYRTVREIIQEELKTALGALPKPEKLQVPDAPDMSFVDALFGSLGAITREIGRIPKEGTNLTSLNTKLDNLVQALKDRPQFERTDLSNVVEIVDRALAAIRELSTQLGSSHQQIVQGIEVILNKTAEDLKVSIPAAVEEIVQSQELTLPVAMKVTRPKKEPQAPAAPDLSHLMS
jgi:flagellin-like hook-associated protein FlgL